MCGIVGIVYRDHDRHADPRLLQRMCAAIRHRGPDDEGYFCSGSVGLGMRRLSIIDLSGGHQPVFNERRSSAVVFNGEIYNYRKLRTGLLQRGHKLGSSGDTETIVHLYEEQGPDCVRSLRGMFALAVWDGDARELFLARDRFGIKPLYYTLGPWGIAFASELKALVAGGVTSRELDWEALDAYLQLGYVPAPQTPFTDVRKLEPGHWLLWRDSGAVLIQPYWHLPVGGSSEPPDIERQVLEWIDDSVAAHLVSDVPVAAFLSGGLDSSAVVASAALAGGTPPHVFTGRYLGSGAAEADETGLARVLATRYGAQLTVVDIAPDMRDVFEPIVYALDEPHADDSALPTWMLSQAVGASYKVALTGIGGDELFAGYRRHLGLRAAEQYSRLPGPLRSAASALGQFVPDSMGAGLTIDRMKRFLRTARGSTAECYFGLLSRADDRLREQLYAPALRRAVTRNTARDRFRSLYDSGGEPNGLNAALYLDYKTFLADDVLALSDRLSMAHSLEIRVPLVDHELAEKIFPLPARLKVGSWKPSLKRLLKRALAGRLPAGHLTAPKRGFVGPTAQWLRHELRPMLLDELSANRIERLGYFDSTSVGGLLDDHFSQRHNREGILWGLLCFSTWHRLYVEGPAAASPTREVIPAATAS